MQEKVIQNYALYCVGWVDKPNISDGLWICWVGNPTYPLVSDIFRNLVNLVLRTSVGFENPTYAC